MKIIVTGSSGLLGNKVYKVLSDNHDVGGFYLSKAVEGHRKLDITKYKDVVKMFTHISPDIIVHTASLSNADFCESNKKKAKKINILGTYNIVKICKQKKAKLIFISSDYIFNGEPLSYFEDSNPHPINYYGHTKLEGERIVREELNNFAIIRPTILYGFNDEHDKPTFLSDTIKKLINSKPLSVDAHIKKYPLLIDDLAAFISKIIDEDLKGIFHIKGKDKVTRYEWALEIAKNAGFNKNLVKKYKSKNMATKPFDIDLKSKHKKLSRFKTVGIEKGIKIYNMQKGCVFKLLYSAKPDASVMGQRVALFRIKVGQFLAEEHPVGADIVIPIPESGIFPATGYANKLKKPLIFGVVRDYVTKRTLFTSNLKNRLSMVDSKLATIPDLIKGKKVVLIDEAIISGTTLKVMAKKIRKAGAREIHVRIPSPFGTKPCFARMHPPKIKLIHHKLEKEGVRRPFEKLLSEYLEVEDVAFLSLENIKKAVDSCVKTRCFYCYE